MADIVIRTWRDAPHNKFVNVTYTDFPARLITAEPFPIDDTQPYPPGVGYARDGVVDGTELARFCEGTTLVVLTATDAEPFATIAVTPGSPTCDGSTLAIVRASGFAAGTIEVQGSGGVAPYTASAGGATATATSAGLATLTGIAPGAYTATLTDAAGIVRTASVLVPAAVINGCTLPGALNYNPNATDNDGSCLFVVLDEQPTDVWPAHAPIPVRLRAAPIDAQPAVVLLTIETATPPGSALPWALVGTLRQQADPVFATVAFNVSELCKSVLRIAPPVELGNDPALSALCRLSYVVQSAAGVNTYAAVFNPFRVINAVRLPEGADPLSLPVYTTRPVGSALWVNRAIIDAATAEFVDVPESAGDWPCPTRQFVWLNPFGGWESGFFAGRHQHGTDQADPIAYRDANGADKYASRGTVRPTLQVYSDKLTYATYQAIRGIRDSIQVYERIGAGQYVPVLLASGSYTDYQEQTDKTFTVDFTISYPPVLIQTQ